MRRAALRILAVDNELLIAMEVDHILSSALPCNVEVSGYAGLEERLAAPPPYDLVLFDTDVPLESLGLLVDRARKAGSSVAFVSASDLYRDGVPGLGGIPVIPKPYEPERMIEVVCTLMPRLERLNAETRQDLESFLPGPSASSRSSRSLRKRSGTPSSCTDL